MSCVEVASVAISGKDEAKQAEQWEVGYIFPDTELLSLQRRSKGQAVSSSSYFFNYVGSTEDLIPSTNGAARNAN